MTDTSAIVPARANPAPAPLTSLRLVQAVIRNPLEAWPRAVYVDPIYRPRQFGREIVYVSDPELIRQVLVEQADAFVKAESMRRALRPALGDAILTADGASWRWQRRAAAPIFRHERIVGFVPAMLRAAGRTRERWIGAQGTELDVAREMMRTTFDIIVETMLSGRGGIDVDRVERGITDYLESTSWVIALTLVRAPAWLPYPGRRRAEAARDELRAELLRLVQDRRRAGERREDLITLLLEARDPETGQTMDDRDIADNLLTFITAGHETTALALTWAFYLLSLHPEAEARTLREIEAVTDGGPLEAAHLDRLVYTRQVLQESMRLYPPAPVVVRAAKRDVRIGEALVQKGSPVYVPVYAVHRHEALWDGPDRFDPDRFAPERVKSRHRYAYLPFGAGPRVCIGMSFAMLEAVAIFATLLPALRLRLRPGYVPELKLRITLRPAGGMPMRVAPR
jgi:cytochrome P450